MLHTYLRETLYMILNLNAQIIKALYIYMGGIKIEQIEF